jgi:hypothetical protein
MPSAGPTAVLEHNLEGYGLALGWTVTTSTTYNFAGKPLYKTVVEHTNPNTQNTNITPPDVTYQTVYAYCYATNYFPQNATQSDTTLGGSETVNYTYTDYYTNAAAAGSRGQKYLVYDPKCGAITASGPQWQYNVAPGASGIYSGKYIYDSIGRCTQVYKLQSVSNTTGNYVETLITYGGSVPNNFGAATKVQEDYNGINRTTTTTAFTGWGKAEQVTDGAGHIFLTNFDNDGNVQSVYRKDSGLNQVVASYSYTSGLPTQVADGLSGVTDNISYDLTQGDPGAGQVLLTKETNGSVATQVGYGYSASGDRQSSQYVLPSETVNWGYYDYVNVGSPDKGKRVFQTVNRLNSNLSLSSEEFHYAYDSSGALYAAAFVQTL